jgi:hypothetical protein
MACGSLEDFVLGALDLSFFSDLFLASIVKLLFCATAKQDKLITKEATKVKFKNDVFIGFIDGWFL